MDLLIYKSKSTIISCWLLLLLAVLLIVIGSFRAEGEWGLAILVLPLVVELLAAIIIATFFILRCIVVGITKRKPNDYLITFILSIIASCLFFSL